MRGSVRDVENIEKGLMVDGAERAVEDNDKRREGL